MRVRPGQACAGEDDTIRGQLTSVAQAGQTVRTDTGAYGRLCRLCSTAYSSISSMA